MAAVWGRTVVESANLTVQISVLRRILDETRTGRSCIQTVATRGYRFVGPVTMEHRCVGFGGVYGAPRLSIVVLPFANLSNDPEQEYFADGITDDLTTDLSRIPGTFVIARNTAFTYRGREVGAKQISRQLGVRYVLEGSVRRLGNRMRINAQLIDAETEAHLWADWSDSDFATLSQAQSEITGRLAHTINFKIVEAERQRIERESAPHLDPRDLLIRGWAALARPVSAAARQEALRNFEQALETDPNSVDARIGVANTLTCNIGDGWSASIREDEARAEQFLLEAIEGDGDNFRARQGLGILRRLQNRLDESRIELKTAITLLPNYAPAFCQLGMTLTCLGQPDVAIPEIEKSIRLGPHDAASPTAYSILSQAHLLLGNENPAIEFARKACASNPRLYFTHMLLAAALGLKGDRVEAKAALAEGVKIKPGFNSLARLREYCAWGNARFLALREGTIYLGLRRAGMPD
jgi:TolB-like protein/Flp pilus assembly protein TadD